MLPEWAKVGLTVIDDRHEGFWRLLEQLKGEKDDAIFVRLFEEMVADTALHFDAEEADMRAISSQNLHEHASEHKKALEEMGYFYAKAKNGMVFFARNYVNDRAENWFRQHLLNMDNDLARQLFQASK
jgi:hemerythrin